MSEESKEQKQETVACGPGCACGTSRSRGRGRYVAGIAILIVAGVLVARAVVKDKGTRAASTSPGFSTLSAAGQAPDSAAESVPPAVTETAKEVESLAELNKVASDMSGVFLFVPGKGETASTAPMALLRNAARTIEPRLRGGKIGMFTLRAGSRDYEQLARQMAVPGVVALVKGAGMSATSGNVTEAKLVQAFVAASRMGGCAPSGCGPSGCR